MNITPKQWQSISMEAAAQLCEAEADRLQDIVAEMYSGHLKRKAKKEADLYESIATEARRLASDIRTLAAKIWPRE